MLDIILILTGLLGFGIASYYDIKTTEFSETIPYGMIVVAILAKLTSAYLTGGYDLFFTSIANGIFLLFVGLALYYLGQWGDGDAFLLGTLGFLFPIPNAFFSPEFMLPLPAALVFNTFAIGSVYTILSAAYIGLTNKKIWKIFAADIRDNRFRIAAAIVLFFAVLLALPIAIGWYLGLSVPVAAVGASLWTFPFVVLLVL
ncbi:MAG: prepilin peptidase, partial [Candidatus Aenigmatarchaeota archaeon]